MKWKWFSLAAWMLIAVVATMFAGSVSDVESSDIRSWLPATAESTRALDLAEAHFSTDDPENLLIVYARDGLTEADRAAVAADAATLKSLPPISSQDGKALLLMLPLSKAESTEDAIAPILQRVRDVVQDGLPAGLAARLTGGPAAEADFLALLTLLFADLNSTRGLGPVAAIGIACALLAMTTVLPALLVLCGRWAFWPLIPTVGSAEKKGWSGVANLIAARPRPIWIATALALATVGLGTTTLSVGLKQSESFTAKPESVHGFELLAAHYPAGSSSPAEIYVSSGKSKRVEEVVLKLAGVDHVEEPESSGGWTKLPVILGDDPGGAKAEETVGRLRQAVHAIDPAGLVGGSTAQALDQDSTMDSDLRLVIPLILLVVLGVLMVLLRALVAPLLLLASVVLSFGAALGASAGVFHLLGFPTLDKTVLLNGFLFLVALGVDYTIFLMTRAREETALIGHRAGVPKALAVTGGVITSAGIVLAATFSVLAVMPVVFMLQLGVVVAVGVLLDTFVVRSLLVPALVLDVGPRVWWPTSRYP